MSGTRARHAGVMMLLGFMLFVVGCATSRVGQPAPDFRLATVDDKIFALSDLRGQKNGVLVFYASHS